MKKTIMTTLAISTILIGCGKEEVSPKTVEQLSSQTQEQTSQVKEEPVVQISGASETVKEMYRTSRDGDVQAFTNIASEYAKSMGLTMEDAMSGFAEMMEYKGGLEEMTIEDVEKSGLAPFYLEKIESEFGPYGQDIAVVVEWSFNNDIEPLAWVVQRHKDGNKVIRRDVQFQEGSKFTFYPNGSSEESSGGNTVLDVMRKSPYNTLSMLYDAALNGDQAIYDQITQFHSGDISMSSLAENVMKAGSTGDLRIEEIPREQIHTELDQRLVEKYGDDYVMMVEWMTDTYLQLYVLKPVNDYYFLMWSEDEGKDEFLSDYVTSEYQ